MSHFFTKNVLHIFGGIIIIIVLRFIIGSIISIYNFYLTFYLAKNRHLSGLETTLKDHYITFSYLFPITLIIGSFFVGWKIKKRGWYYGLLTGITYIVLINLVSVILTISISNSLLMYPEASISYWVSFLGLLVINLCASVLGGWLG